MRPLSDTITRLARLRSNQVNLHRQDSESHLSDLGAFGSNPGALSGRLHVPDDVDRNAALVVVLHGCTQTATDYDTGAGWSTLADEFGFIVLFAEQSRGNNPNLCFNWFVPAHATRDRGEAASIRQMIEAVVKQHGVDRKQIFITGLSAGGAMANVMLAAYPEVFAGGAIIAGLPFGAATSVPQAFDRMRGHAMPRPAQLQAMLSAASEWKGPWPKLSVWHGTADATVVPINARAIVDQWRGVHGVDSDPTSVETLDGHERMIWSDRHGEVVIEAVMVSDMAHGTPLDPDSGYGRAGPFMLDAGISSTLHIARSWGLAPSFASRGKKTGRIHEKTGKAVAQPSKSGGTSGIQKVIEDALRSAGLMK